MKKLRLILWRILGFDYEYLLHKTDFTLLKYDKFTNKGEGTYDNGAKVWRWTDAFLGIGKYCSIANGVTFIVDEGYHNMSEITNYPFVNNFTDDADLLKVTENKKQKEGIVIGNDVWIGINTIILPGITIGNGVTIAAGSVVTKNIPDYVTVAGIPADIIKHKCTDNQKTALNNIAWWNWPSDVLERRKSDFYKLTIEEFITKYDQ